VRGQYLRYIGVGAGVVLSVLFGYLAIRQIRIAATWDALRSSNYLWLLPVTAALALSVAMRIYRWGLLFEPARRPGFAPLAKATLIGLFFNNILPARAGEAARVVALRSSAGTSMAEAAATIVVERLFDVLGLFALWFVCAPWLPHVIWLRAALVVAVGALAAVVLLAIAARFLARSPAPASPLARVRFLSHPAFLGAMSNVTHGLAALRRPPVAVAASLWTIGGWVMFGIACWWLMIGFGIHVSPLAGLLVVVAIGLAFIVPAAPAAVGVFEAAGLAALSAYGVPSSRAFAYVLVLHALNFFPFIAVGVALLVSERHRTTTVLGQNRGGASPFPRDDCDDVKKVQREAVTPKVGPFEPPRDGTCDS
jgi:uncharacterized protein (TIRG00374 family)